MANKYRSFVNTLIHEDGTLSGIVVVDSNGFKERWGLNERFHPNASTFTFEQAMKVYDSDYWPAGLENLTSQVMANLVFDFGFNHGKDNAIIVFQRWLGIKADGIIGPETIQVANSKISPAYLQSLAESIEAIYDHIGGPYVNTWKKRVQENLKSAGI